MNLHDYLKPDGLFVAAFAPLRAVLNQQAELLWQTEEKPKPGKKGKKDKQDETNQKKKEFSPWVTRSGKGGGDPRYLAFDDVSLYRHCMDVAIIAFMIFLYAWKNGKIPGLATNPSTAAEQDAILLAVKQLFAIAFLHDADKYVGAEQSTSPEFDQVQQLHQDLRIDQWAHLDVELSFALASLENRGQGKAISAGVIPNPTQQELREMVKLGDKIASVTSRHGLMAMVTSYNEKYLSSLHEFGVPKMRLKLLAFHYNALILHKLQRHLLDYFIEQQVFPLVCLLDGQRLYVTAPETDVNLQPVFDRLGKEIGFKPADLKRNPTNGEVATFNVHGATELITTVFEKLEARLLAIHVSDWEVVHPYIRGWASKVGGLSTLDQPENKKLVLTVTPEHEETPPPLYQYALALATALRANSTGKVFDERVQRLMELPELECHTLSQQFDVSQWKKDTRQTLYAMQAASYIRGETHLVEVITQVVKEFPAASEEDAGTRTILTQLQLQCGLVEEISESQLPYTAAAKGGTCLLCGYPTSAVIETSRMKLAGIKKTAFNNRIGHQKNIWSQTDDNYLCPACIKQQELLCQQVPKLRAEPLLVCTPFRGLIKPISPSQLSASVSETDQSALEVCNSFDAVNSKEWRKMSPWNIDTSGLVPFVSESIDTDFDSVVEAMYRWAVFALHTGNPVHVFISAPRDNCKGAFLFEQMPPLIGKLLEDLTVQTQEVQAAQFRTKEDRQEAEQLVQHERGTIRRQKLPALVKRLDLLKQILKTNHGHDVLAMMPAFRWWAVAWLDAREEHSKNFLVRQAKENYPMTQHDMTIAQMAKLARQIQKYPDDGFKASGSERTLALTTAIELLETGRKYQRNRTDTVAAMAETLAEKLNRRSLARSKDGTREDKTFYSQCKEFAEMVYDFVESQRQQGQFDSQFHRFLLAAYAFLFMEKMTETEPA